MDATAEAYMDVLAAVRKLEKAPKLGLNSIVQNSNQ